MKNLNYLWMVLLSVLCIACTPSGGEESQVATYLKVTPAEITFDATADNTFIIDTDGSWMIIASSSVTLSAKNGEAGVNEIKVLAMNSTSNQNIVIRTPSNPSLVGIVKILPSKSGDGGGGGTTPTPTPGTSLYYDNLDGDTSYTNWANQSTAWQNITGEGASNVRYESSYAKMRNDSYGSASHYTGASSGSYMRIYSPTEGTNYLEVHDIATNGEKNLTFSFGAAFQASQCNLFIKGDDSEWKRLEYTASASYNVWTLAEASFTLTNSVAKVSFRIEPTDANANYGYNIDDLRLETSTGGQSVGFEATANYRWAELPKAKTSKADYVYNSHWSNSVNSNKRVRNYSYCYDVRRHSPMWIAHPQHAVYEEGGKTRPASDPWACDPYLTTSQSAIMWKLNGYTCSLRTYFDSGFYQWGRGHMLASSYRGCGDKNNPAEINKQTFYSSNVAAQRAKTADGSADCAFQILWGAAEKKIQDSYICSDTLYVVSGAHFANENTTATDANMYDLPSYCKSCVVPTHFYKIVLRTKSGNTGKAIQECSASELKAVGFWFSNTDTDEQTGLASPTLSKVHLRSVAEIERLTGTEFNFFPDVPSEVKQNFTASDWGF